MPRIRFFILPPPFPLSPDCSVVVVVSFSSFSLYLVVRSVIGPAIRMDTQLFIPHDVGSPRIGRTGSEDKRTNIGFEWDPWCIITSRHQRGIFKFKMGLVGHLSQGLERKSSSMQKKEKERERQGERPIEREKEIVRERGRGEVGGRAGSESTTKACVTSASEISCYRLSSVFLFFSPSPSPRPIVLPLLSSPLLSLFAFTPTVYEDSPIVCRFAHNERTRVRKDAS